jgi:hypothetical protein
MGSAARVAGRAGARAWGGDDAEASAQWGVRRGASEGAAWTVGRGGARSRSGVCGGACGHA